MNDNNSEIQYQPIDPADMRQRLPQFSSEKLCSIIVCHRYFGGFQEEAVMCMQELSDRRQAGQAFPFEEFIEQSLAKLPVLKKGTNLQDVMRTMDKVK
jgi:hypothetical protein